MFGFYKKVIGEVINNIIRKPRLLIYENDGKGNFTARHIIDEGTGIHEACPVDFDGDGKIDIIGKPLHGPEK